VGQALRKAEVFNNFFSGVLLFTSDSGICPNIEERIGGDGLSTVTFTPNIVRQVLKQEGQHPLTGQRAANFRLLANQ